MNSDGNLSENETKYTKGTFKLITLCLKRTRQTDKQINKQTKVHETQHKKVNTNPIEI